MELGLEYVTALVTRLGAHISSPHKRLNIVHVAGTNGKGSTCAYISHCLRECGYVTGRFNSPHLVAQRDCVTINCKPVNEELWNEALTYVNSVADELNPRPSNFEVLTGVALHIFAHQKVDFAVVEVGLGGRLDATNVIDNALLSIILKIAFDHQGMLGDKIEQIASEKAGILKKGGTCIMGPQKYPKAEATITKFATSLGIPFIKVTEAEQTTNRELIYEDGAVTLKYTTGLHGDFQRQNSSVAIAAMLELAKRGFKNITLDNIRKGLQKTRWPGRMQWIETKEFGTILIDGAHNKDAAAALGRYVDANVRKGKGIRWVFAATQSKKLNDMFTNLQFKTDDIVVATQFEQPTGMPWIKCHTLRAIKAAAGRLPQSPTVYDSNDIGEAFKLIKDLPEANSAPVVVCGSLYLVASFFKHVGQNPFEQTSIVTCVK